MHKDDIDNNHTLVKLNGNLYNVYIRNIKWINGDARLHIIEEHKRFQTENLNSHLMNDQYTLILKQFTSELKKLLSCVVNELDDIDKDSQQFKNLRKSIKLMSSMIEEINYIIGCAQGQVPQAEKESFNLKELCDEVYNMMAPKIREKRLEYTQHFEPDLRNINISSEKSTIKQILLNLVANSIINIERGKLSVD